MCEEVAGLMGLQVIEQVVLIENGENNRTDWRSTREYL